MNVKLLFQKSSPNPDREELQLKRDLADTKTTLETVMSNLEHVNDPTLIDCYIYELKSVQLRYQFLLERAKEIGI